MSPSNEWQTGISKSFPSCPLDQRALLSMILIPPALHSSILLAGNISKFLLPSACFYRLYSMRLRILYTWPDSRIVQAWRLWNNFSHYYRQPLIAWLFNSNFFRGFCSNSATSVIGTAQLWSPPLQERVIQGCLTDAVPRPWTKLLLSLFEHFFNSMIALFCAENVHPQNFLCSQIGSLTRLAMPNSVREVINCRKSSTALLDFIYILPVRSSFSLPSLSRHIPFTASYSLTFTSLTHYFILIFTSLPHHSILISSLGLLGNTKITMKLSILFLVVALCITGCIALPPRIQTSVPVPVSQDPSPPRPFPAGRIVEVKDPSPPRPFPKYALVGGNPLEEGYSSVPSRFPTDEESVVHDPSPPRPFPAVRVVDMESPSPPLEERDPSAPHKLVALQTAATDPSPPRPFPKYPLDGEKAIEQRDPLSRFPTEGEKEAADPSPPRPFPAGRIVEVKKASPSDIIERRSPSPLLGTPEGSEAEANDPSPPRPFSAGRVVEA